MLRSLLLAMGLALVVPCMAAGLPSPPAVGELPPQSLGKDRKGNAIDLANYRGKVAIVTFWASWCGPCRRELPVLGRFQQVVGRDALEVVAVNFKEPRGDFVAVVRLNRELDLTWVHDAGGTASDLYGVRALPHMFILDHDGRVAYTHRGYSEESLPGIIDEILSLLPDEVKDRPAGRHALSTAAATGVAARPGPVAATASPPVPGAGTLPRGGAAARRRGRGFARKGQRRNDGSDRVACHWSRPGDRRAGVPFKGLFPQELI